MLLIGRPERAKVFGIPVLHGRSLPPASWTRFILRKLYSKKKIAADHLIHLVIFTMSALLLPAPMMKTANSRTEAGREHPV